MEIGAKGSGNLFLLQGMRSAPILIGRCLGGHLSPIQPLEQLHGELEDLDFDPIAFQERPVKNKKQEQENRKPKTERKKIGTAATEKSITKD